MRPLWQARFSQIEITLPNHNNSIVRRELFKPLPEILTDVKPSRSCSVIDDSLWLEAGVRRCLGPFQSERDFLQHLADNREIDIRVSTWFESFKSSRRLRFLKEINQRITQRMKRSMPDPFAYYTSFRDFDIYAVDGYFVAAAMHDKAIARPGVDAATGVRQTTKKFATPHIYSIDLRSHAMSHLAVVDQVARKKEHEMRTLKRQDTATLRQGAPKGCKVLYVWDRAGIDFRPWFEWKTQSGIYFLSRQKDNMKLEVMGEHTICAAEPDHAGVIPDQIAGTGQGVSMRRVVFKDMETGGIYVCLVIRICVQKGVPEDRQGYDTERV